MLAGSNSRLIGRPDGHEGYLIPHLDVEESHEFSDEFDVDGDVEKKHHHHKKTTTKKPSAGHVHGGRQVVQERVDIVDSQHVRLEVPQLEMLTSASVLHDFNSVRFIAWSKYFLWFDAADQVEWFVCIVINEMWYAQKWTAFLDDNNHRCYVKPLSKLMVSPPRSLMDLLVKIDVCVSILSIYV